MSYLISDAQLRLANRLGSNTSPTETAELTKRRTWFEDAINKVLASEPFFWFMKTYAQDTAITNKPYYSVPTLFRHPIEVKVDGIIYEKTTKENFDKKHSNYNRIVTIPQVSLEYEYYIYNNNVYFSPELTSPTALSVTLTSSTTTVTATSSSAHGYLAGQYVTIAGANETAYNGTFEIVTAPTTTTFTYTALSTPSATPATGTITSTLKNIEYWYYKDNALITAESDSIVLPDRFISILVSYAEGRYWSSAHKRGKAADGFTEFESGINDLRKENFRRMFGQND